LIICEYANTVIYNHYDLWCQQPMAFGRCDTTNYLQKICSKKDHRLPCIKHYKIIVDSTTDVRDCLLYRKYRDNNIMFTIEDPNIIRTPCISI
jgi:hypothetical protein